MGFIYCIGTKLLTYYILHVYGTNCKVVGGFGNWVMLEAISNLRTFESEDFVSIVAKIRGEGAIYPSTP